MAEKVTGGLPRSTKRQKKWRERLNISRWAIAHPKITLGFWIAVTVAGILAFSSLKYALFPEITFPVVVIHASAPLSTALEVEAQLTQPIEAQLAQVPKLDYSRSLVYPGQTIVSGIFPVGINLETVAAAAEKGISDLSLPQGTQLKVIPLNLNESSVLSYAVMSDRQSIEKLREVILADFLPPLSQLPGVLRVDLLGDGLAAPQNPPNPDIFPIPGQPPPRPLVRFNGNNALAFSIVKRRDANTLEVVSRVEHQVAQLQQLHPDIQLSLAATDAPYIHEATQSTIDALWLAIVLAVLIIFVFLQDFAATFIAALAIPTSILATFIAMAIGGFKLETITLLALALVIGIVVDDAIVEVENVARHLEMGKSPLKAAIAATNEIGLTVAASTLTIAAVFIPVGLMGGTVGQFFKPFGLTISAAVLASLLVSRTLTPILAVAWLKRSKKETKERLKPSFLSNSYVRILSWSLHHRRTAIAIAILSLITGIGLIPFIPKGFIPQLDRGEFTIVYTFDLPKITLSASPEALKSPSSSGWIAEILKAPEKILLRKSRQIAEQLEPVVLALPEVEKVYTVMGLRGEPNHGKLQVILKGDRQATTQEIQEYLRQHLPDIPKVTLSVENTQFVDTVDQKPVQILLAGEDLGTLTTTAQTFQQTLALLPQLADLEITDSGIQPLSDEPKRIDRYQGNRVITISANLSAGGAIGNITDKIQAIAQSQLPPNIHLIIAGEGAQSSEVFSSFGTTLIWSTLSMLGLLWLMFGRFQEPLVVGLSLPLSIVGAMLALLITQSDFGIISLLGLIFLLGLLDKNALLLMDYANQLRHQGMERNRALLETGKVRLRPILMTTGSTLLGMLPLALGLGAGAELRQPMAVAIMGGLITSTLLSLIIVPVLYTLLEDSWEMIAKKRSA